MYLAGDVNTKPVKMLGVVYMLFKGCMEPFIGVAPLGNLQARPHTFPNPVFSSSSGSLCTCFNMTYVLHTFNVLRQIDYKVHLLLYCIYFVFTSTYLTFFLFIQCALKFLLIKTIQIGLYYIDNHWKTLMK